MERDLTSALQKLSVNTYVSKGTSSSYFMIGCIKVRVSDHMSFNSDGDLTIFSNKRGSHSVYAVIPLIGTYKEVQWFYSIKGVIDFIIKYESMARLMIKFPAGYNTKKDDTAIKRLEKYADIPTDGKIDYMVWMKHLQFIYASSNSPELIKLADEIWKADGTHKTFDIIRKTGPLTPTERGVRLNQILTELKGAK